MKAAAELGFLAFLLAAYQTTGVLQRGIPAEWAPQRSGADALSVALGDARALLSESLVEKADDYFHGGATHECEGIRGEEHHHEKGEEGHEQEHAVSLPPFSSPFLWLNAHIHTQEHRHVKEAESQELLPWLWAACRADPHNTLAYETSAYVLERMTHHPEKAVELLQEGIRNNPENASLPFSLGEIYFHRMKEWGKAEIAFATARAKCRDTENDKLLRLRSLAYLGFLADKRNDRKAILTYLAEARTLSPKHSCTTTLEKLAEKKP